MPTVILLTSAYAASVFFINSAGYLLAMAILNFLGWHKHTQVHNGILIDGEG